MADPRRLRGWPLVVATLLTLSVALGAVLVAAPVDAWTPVSANAPAAGPPVGHHALAVSPVRTMSPGSSLWRRALGSLHLAAGPADLGSTTAAPTHDAFEVLSTIPSGPRWWAGLLTAPDRAPPRS